MKADPRATIIRSMKITLNGQTHELPDEGATVETLVARLGLEATPVAVEVNRDVVPRRRHPEHQLRDGDAVEVVSLVGGG